MENMLQQYNFNNAPVRVVEIDGDPWFVAKDVCDVLGIINNRDALSRLDEDEKDDVGLTDTIGRRQKTNVVNEYGLYNLILSSRKPEAKEFKRWVTHEVLPAIRKTGKYALPQAKYQIPESFADALQLAADQQRQIDKQQKVIETKDAQIKRDVPKVEFFDTVTKLPATIDIGEAAKTLNMGMGRNNLFKFLKDKKILMSDNLPYQEYVDRGYFKTIIVKFRKGKEDAVHVKTIVYMKGLEFIRKTIINHLNTQQLTLQTGVKE